MNKNILLLSTGIFGACVTAPPQKPREVQMQDRILKELTPEAILKAMGDAGDECAKMSDRLKIFLLSIGAVRHDPNHQCFDNAGYVRCPNIHDRKGGRKTITGSIIDGSYDEGKLYEVTIINMQNGFRIILGKTCKPDQ